MQKRVIPTRIVLLGDRARSQSVLDIARQRLGGMLETIERSKGRILQGWRRPIVLPTGEVIRLCASFNTSVIEIFSESSGIGEGAVTLENAQICYCNCNISYGRIVKDDKELMYGYIPVYDIEACYRKEMYVFYENILASDFSRYVLGQPVIVMAYNMSLFNCCFLEDEPVISNVPTGCDPLVQSLGIDIEAFRTTYRILPLCPSSISAWTEV